MKKKTVLILMASVMLIMAGCHKTPDTPVVTEKNQEMMIEIAQSGKENSSQLSSLEVPEMFSGDWSGVDDCVVVHADAAITLPDSDLIPTAKIERQPFSQTDADKILDVFLDGSTLWQEQGFTRQMAQERLEHYQAIQRGEIPWEHDGTIDELPGLIEYYAELVRTAPDEGERTPAPTTYHTDSFWGDVIEGCAEVNNKLMHVSIRSGSAQGDEALVYVDGYGDLMGCKDVYVDQLPESVEVNMTEDAALEMGKALMERLGMGTFVCDQIKAVVYFNSYESELVQDRVGFDTGYEMEFVRTVNGFPIAHCPRYQIEPDGLICMLPAINGTAVPENESYIGTWAYERVTINVNKDGVVYFSWTNPYSEPEIQTADTQLMSFSDISDIFAKMIIVKNSDQKVVNEKSGFVLIREIDIDNVRLSLMRIRSKDNFDEGLLVPVWDFWGTQYMDVEDETYRDMVYAGKQYSVMLTVNAIDGTIIDRNVGY